MFSLLTLSLHLFGYPKQVSPSPSLPPELKALFHLTPSLSLCISSTLSPDLDGTDDADWERWSKGKPREDKAGCRCSSGGWLSVQQWRLVVGTSSSSSFFLLLFRPTKKRKKKPDSNSSRHFWSHGAGKFASHTCRTLWLFTSRWIRASKLLTGCLPSPSSQCGTEKRTRARFSQPSGQKKRVCRRTVGIDFHPLKLAIRSC